MAACWPTRHADVRQSAFGYDICYADAGPSIKNTAPANGAPQSELFVQEASIAIELEKYCHCMATAQIINLETIQADPHHVSREKIL